ncbi:hypothetical protein T4B_1407 [Trichinella pseudospiralis]|uniref:Uncharacterized protein n=1 Tax=Trichinella pseudospiralis TaxID=6337 RepID=A0A0V1G8B8_TRIPS|nr:hypothetical protein T4B_1407 [Trichinella pseudospiralis]
MSIFVKKGFSGNLRNFLNYRLACFAKNGEKLFERNVPTNWRNKWPLKLNII